MIDDELTAERRIVRVACELFGRHGFEGVSFRKILREAAVNVAAGHYYFGSKEALYIKTVESELVPIVTERSANLELIANRLPGDTVAVRDLLHAYMWPHLRRFSDPSNHDYLKVIARFPLEPRDLVGPLFAQHISPVRNRYVEALQAISGGADLQMIRRFMGWMIQLMSLGPFDISYSVMIGGDALPDDPKLFCAQLTDAGAAAFQALAGSK